MVLDSLRGFSGLVRDLPLSYRLREAAGAPRGLVLLLHGVGGNETSMAPLAAGLAPDLTVALVRSRLTTGPDAYAAFPVRFTPNGPVIDEAAAEESRLTLVRFVAELQARLGIEPSRTLVAGFSQGGIMSASLALTEPEAVRGFAILSGRILPQIAPLVAPPDRLAHLDALILHGTEDGTLPVSWAERSRQWLGDLGIPLDDRRYPAAHEITPAMARDFSDWAGRILPDHTA